MFLEVDWFVPELLATFRFYVDLGLLSLIRGLHVFPLKKPLESWDDVAHWNHMVPSIGEAPLNWFRLSEVDIVIRPWVVRRACIDKVGALDEAFCPIEWDEADLAYRVRERGGWKVATHNYERLGAFTHLGSSTLGRNLSEKYKALILVNGRLFHERWQDVVRSSTRGAGEPGGGFCRRRACRSSCSERPSSACSRRAACSRACAPPRRSYEPAEEGAHRDRVQLRAVGARHGRGALRHSPLARRAGQGRLRHVARHRGGARLRGSRRSRDPGRHAMALRRGGRREGRAQAEEPLAPRTRRRGHWRIVYAVDRDRLVGGHAGPSAPVARRPRRPSRSGHGDNRADRR